MNDLYKTIEIDGTQFNVYVFPDDCHYAPWEECDGHGPVSEWTSRAKKPGEIELYYDNGWRYYYDFQEACRIARRDGWGCSFPDETMTKRQIAARAARDDYDRLRHWCNGDWGYVNVQVCLCDDDGDEVDGESEIMGGFESDDKDSINNIASQLAQEILRRLEVFA
jgi:hypothetical protein